MSEPTQNLHKKIYLLSFGMEAKNYQDAQSYASTLQQKLLEQGYLVELLPSFLIDVSSQMRGYILRDYLVDLCEILSKKQSLTPVSSAACIVVSGSLEPKVLSAIEEASAILKSRRRWLSFQRFFKPLNEFTLISYSSFLSKNSKTLEDVSELDEGIAKIKSVVNDRIPPGTFFKSPQTIYPWVKTTFKVWILSILLSLILVLWLMISLQNILNFI